MRLRALMALAILAGTVVGCSEDGPDAGPLPSPVPSAEPIPSLPDGWRWESYRDVEVGVPGTWGYTNAARVNQQCALSDRARPAVGRPGGAFDLGGCRGPLPQVDPGALVANAGTFVALLPTSETVVEEGDRIVVIPNAVTQVVIQAPPALRQKIAATVHRIPTVDHNGCAVHHPLVEDPSWRPAPVDDATLADLDSVRACRYTPLAPEADAGPTVSLYSSLRLDGGAARAALTRVAAAPRDKRPQNRPDSCADGFGREAIVLRAMRGEALVGEIVIRYAGCDDRGFDDGTTLRRLTADAIGPFVAQPNRPFGYARTPELRRIMRPTKTTVVH